VPFVRPLWRPPRGPGSSSLPVLGRRRGRSTSAPTVARMGSDRSFELQSIRWRVIRSQAMTNSFASTPAFRRASSTSSAFVARLRPGRGYGSTTAGSPQRSPSSRQDRGGGPGFLESRLVFKVPALELGRYTVRGCWTPCRPESLIGRAKIWIGATERDARLLVSLAHAENRTEALRESARRARERWWSSAERLGDRREDLARAKSRIEALENRVWVLEGGLRTRFPFLLTAFVAGALVGIFSASLMRRVGRTGAPRSATVSQTHT
jgi:hypothetical protein